MIIENEPQFTFKERLKPRGEGESGEQVEPRPVDVQAKYEIYKTYLDQLADAEKKRFLLENLQNFRRRVERAFNDLVEAVKRRKEEKEGKKSEDVDQEIKEMLSQCRKEAHQQYSKELKEAEKRRVKVWKLGEYHIYEKQFIRNEEEKRTKNRKIEYLKKRHGDNYVEKESELDKAIDSIIRIIGKIPGFESIEKDNNNLIRTCFYVYLSSKENIDYSALKEQVTKWTSKLQEKTSIWTKLWDQARQIRWLQKWLPSSERSIAQKGLESLVGEIKKIKDNLHAEEEIWKKNAQQRWREMIERAKAKVDRRQRDLFIQRTVNPEHEPKPFNLGASEGEINLLKKGSMKTEQEDQEPAQQPPVQAEQSTAQAGQPPESKESKSEQEIDSMLQELAKTTTNELQKLKRNLEAEIISTGWDSKVLPELLKDFENQIKSNREKIEKIIGGLVFKGIKVDNNPQIELLKKTFKEAEEYLKILKKGENKE